MNNITNIPSVLNIEYAKHSHTTFDGREETYHKWVNNLTNLLAAYPNTPEVKIYIIHNLNILRTVISKM